MPPQTLPTRERLGESWKVLKPLGFFFAEGLSHFRSTMKSVRVEPPSFRKGAELCFGWEDRNLTVIGWTSYVPSMRKARAHDRGWLVIEQDGEGMYFVPLNRTAGFVPNLTMELRIARYRILYRPRCPQCRELMRIVRGKALGSRYWRCPAFHARESWDTKAFLAALPPDARRYLKRRRAERKRWQRKCKARGKPIRQAMLRKRKWRKIAIPPDEF